MGTVSFFLGQPAASGPHTAIWSTTRASARPRFPWGRDDRSRASRVQAAPGSPRPPHRPSPCWASFRKERANTLPHGAPRPEGGRLWEATQPCPHRQGLCADNPVVTLLLRTTGSPQMQRITWSPNGRESRGGSSDPRAPRLLGDQGQGQKTCPSLGSR